MKVDSLVELCVDIGAKGTLLLKIANFEILGRRHRCPGGFLDFVESHHLIAGLRCQLSATLKGFTSVQ